MMSDFLYEFLGILILFLNLGWHYGLLYYYSLLTFKPEITNRARYFYCNLSPDFYSVLLILMCYLHRIILYFVFLEKEEIDFLLNYRFIIILVLLFFLACVLCYLFNEMYNEIFDEYYFRIDWFSYFYYLQLLPFFFVFFFNFVYFFTNKIFYPSKNKIQSSCVYSRMCYIIFYQTLISLAFHNIFFSILIIPLVIDNYYLIKYNESYENRFFKFFVRLIYIVLFCSICFMVPMYFVLYSYLCYWYYSFFKQLWLFPLILYVLFVYMIRLYIFINELVYIVFYRSSYWLS